MSADVTDCADAEATSKYARLSATDIRAVLELSEGGYTQADIAKVVGCAQSTVSDTLKAFSDTAKHVTQRLKALTDETIEDWRAARKVAASRGDHRPARELLEAAHPEMRPQPAQGQNYGGVTVVVAVPGGIENPRPVIAVSPSPSPTIERKPAESLAIPSTSHNVDCVNHD